MPEQRGRAGLGREKANPDPSSASAAAASGKPAKSLGLWDLHFFFGVEIALATSIFKVFMRTK